MLNFNNLNGEFEVTIHTHNGMYCIEVRIKAACSDFTAYSAEITLGY